MPKHTRSNDLGRQKYVHILFCRLDLKFIAIYGMINYQLIHGGGVMSNPLRAIGDGINDAISIIAGAIVLVLCIIILGFVLSIPH